MSCSNPINVNSITVDMIENFQIHENYMQRYPCSHLCQVILKDGRKVCKSLEGPEIYLLIQVIAKEKIEFKRNQEFLNWKAEVQDINHFNCYENHDWKYFNPGYINPPLPEQILSLVFQ